MNDDSEIGYPQEPPDWGALEARGRAESARREALLRRLRILLAAVAAGFTLTVWFLVRGPALPAWLERGGGPSAVVRLQLEALNRGDLRAAYNLFSPAYRARVPFEAFHRLVVTHRQMFRTQDLDLAGADDVAGRVVLNASLTSADGERYLARFTLVRSEGRWWIDDLRWGAAPKKRVLEA